MVSFSDLEVKVGNVLNNVNDVMKDLQEKFLESNLYNIVNKGLDIGIEIVMPDLIENQVKDLKNIILENGLKEGVKEAVNSIQAFGKSVLGIVTGNFESVSQIKLAVSKGGIIDTISSFLDKSIDKANKNGIISNDLKKSIKSGKNSILKAIESNISAELDNQDDKFEKLEKYNEQWQNCFDNKDFEGMKKAYKNIQKYMKEVIPFENTINTTRKIETLHTLIKNNGGNFDLSTEELELAEAM